IDALAELKEGNQDKAVTDAFIRMLNDADGYVAGRAIMALGAGRDLTQVGRIFEAADRHPELLPELIGSLKKNDHMRNAAIPKLRELASHTSPVVRRAVLNLLATAEEIDISNEIIAGLGDADQSVRLAAAQALPVVADRRRPQNGFVTRKGLFGNTKQVK